MSLSRRDFVLLLGALGVLVLVVVPVLGADPWDFRPGAVDPTGPFAPLVRGADREWDPEALRAAGLLGRRSRRAGRARGAAARSPGRAGSPSL